MKPSDYPVKVREFDTRHLFFFFKQKTAYEIMPSLVGSEMCIRDRLTFVRFSRAKRLEDLMVYEFRQDRQPRKLVDDEG